MSTPPPPVAPFCSRCGAPNPNALTQCAHCGQSLLAAWPPPPGGQYPPQGYPPQPQTTIGGFGGLIPYKNASALTAYYLGVFSLAPCLGIPLGIAAVVLGLRGLKYAQTYPEAKGVTHAWVGIIVGGLCSLLNSVGLIAFLLSLRHP